MNSCALECFFVSPFSKTKLQTLLPLWKKNLIFMKSYIEKYFLGGQKLQSSPFEVTSYFSK